MSAPVPVSPCKKSNAIQKLGYAAFSGTVFAILSTPLMYRLLNYAFGKNRKVLVNDGGCPTGLGIVIQAVIFTGIIYVAMQPWRKQVVCDESK